MNLFEMAATYTQSISKNHPFLDGNKRVAAISALAFLLINGYEYNEKSKLELADTILDFVNGNITKDDLAKYYKSRSIKL